MDMEMLMVKDSVKDMDANIKLEMEKGMEVAMEMEKGMEMDMEMAMEKNMEKALQMEMDMEITMMTTTLTHWNLTNEQPTVPTYRTDSPNNQHCPLLWSMPTRIKSILKTKNLTNCTAISISHSLEILENDNPYDQIYYRQWFSLLSRAQGSGYLNGNVTGDEDEDGFGAEWSSGDGYDSELTYDSSNPLGDGFGHGTRYGDTIGDQNADGTGTGWCYGVCYPCGNGTHDDHHYT